MTTERFPLELQIKAIDEVTAPLRAMSAKLKGFTAPLRKFSLGLSQLGKSAGLKGLGESFKNAKTSITSFASTAGVALAGLVAGGYGLYALVRGAVDAGDELGEMSQRVGMGVDAFASLRYAAEQADVSQEDFNHSLDFFNKGLGQAKAGTGKLLAFLKKVSPALAKQVKGARSTEEGLSLMTDAMTRVEDPSKRAALAMAAFGNMQMGQFLGQGSAEIQKMQVEFLRLHGSQKKFAEDAGLLDIAMRKAEVAFLGLRVAGLAPLMPAFTKIADAVTDFLVKNRDGLQKWAEKTGAAISEWVDGGGIDRLVEGVKELARRGEDLIQKLGGLEAIGKAVALIMGGRFVASGLSAAATLATAGAEVASFSLRLASLAFGPVIAAIGNFIVAIRAGYGVMQAFNLVLLANPIGVVIAAVGLLAAAAYMIYDNWAPIKGFFVSLWEEVTWALRKAWAFMSPIIEKIMKVTDFLPGIGLAVKGVKWAGDKIWGDHGPSLGASAAAARPAAPLSSEATVKVDFSNVPKGTRVSTDRSSTAPVSLDVGYAMGEVM